MSSRSRSELFGVCALSVVVAACDPPTSSFADDAGAVSDARVTATDAGPGTTSADAWTPSSPDAFVPPDASLAPPEPRDPALDACWPGRFCWLEGAWLTSIDGAGEDSVHVVDHSGRVFRHDDGSWRELPGIRERRVLRIHVVARDSVWALTEHRDETGYFVDHFDGTSWTTSWASSDGRVLAGYGDQIWVREPGSSGWLRHDDGGWRSMPAIDERFGTIAQRWNRDGAEPVLVPGPDGTAYALTNGVVPLVIRLRPVGSGGWDFVWELVGPLAAGASDLAWSDGELRAIERRGTPTGTEESELRFDGVRWTPVRTLPEGRWLVASRSGIRTNVHERWCALELVVGDRTYCEGATLRSLEITTDREAPVWTPVPVREPAARPFADALFDEVPPAYWAGAWELVGPIDDHLRLPREEAFDFGERWVEHVRDGVASPVELEGSRMLARRITGRPGRDIYVDDFALFRGRTTRDGFAPMHVELPEPGRTTFAELAITATDDGAWIGHGPRILRLLGDDVRVDVELPSDDFVDEVNIQAIDATDGDVWALATIGHRSRTAALFHRELDGEGRLTYRRIDLGFAFWSGGQIARREDTLFLYFDGGSVPGLRAIPIADLGGATPAQPDERYVRSEVVPPGAFTTSLPEARLWVGARGAWLTTAQGALWWPE